jgi:hypothetical protein
LPGAHRKDQSCAFNSKANPHDSPAGRSPAAFTASVPSRSDLKHATPCSARRNPDNTLIVSDAGCTVRQFRDCLGRIRDPQRVKRERACSGADTTAILR